jgi:hypothetical protein
LTAKRWAVAPGPDRQEQWLGETDMSDYDRYEEVRRILMIDT